jgi:cobalt-zinc-cadmium efflux system protein
MSETCHAHGHTHAPANFDRAFAIGIGLNVGFVLIEALFGWKAGSLALLADAGHNLSDVAGLLLAWVAAFAGRVRPDHRHTYGWQRASILAAFVNAILLLVAMGALAWEAVQRLRAPGSADGATIVIVAAIGVVINGVTAALFMAGSKDDLNIRGAFLHMAADAFVSLGVAVAGGLVLTLGWAWIDPAVSLTIAAVIVVGTWSLFRQSVHLLFDGVPESVDLVALDRWLRSLEGVEDVHDLHVWALSTRDIALTAHLVMPAGHPGDDFYERVEHGLCHEFGISHPTLQIEMAWTDHGCARPAKLC